MKTILVLTIACTFMVGMAYPPSASNGPCKVLNSSTVLCTPLPNTDCTLVVGTPPTTIPPTTQEAWCQSKLGRYLNGDGQFPDVPVAAWIGTTAQVSDWC